MGHILTLRPELSPKGDKAQNPVEAAQLLPHSGRREGTRTAMPCPRDTHNQGTEMAMKVVRQAQLELSGGSTPDLLRPLQLMAMEDPDRLHNSRSGESQQAEHTHPHP